MRIVLLLASVMSAHAIEIDYFGTDGWPADIQFSGATVEGNATQDGLTLYPWQTDYTASAAVSGSTTTIGFYIHGPEWASAFSFNNITGDVLSETWTIQIDWNRIEDVPHSYAFGYDLQTGTGRIQWSEIHAAEPNVTAFRIQQLPDAPWSPALLGIGITGLLITHAKNHTATRRRPGRGIN